MASTTELEKIINPQTSYSNDEDANVWKPTRDKSGNASAVIRFLPKREGDALPFITKYSYGFSTAHHNLNAGAADKGKWYIENCLSTIGLPDPVNEANRALRQTGVARDTLIAQARGRRTNYFANVLIVNDPAAPENNGKVKLFRFGKKIFEKITAEMKPAFEEDTPCNIFDIYAGKNFRLIMKQADGFPNYDSSSFGPITELCDGNEEKMIEVLNSQHSLSDLISPDKFKSYEELSRKFQSVINPTLATSPSATEMTETYVPPVKVESKSNYTTQSTPAAAPSSGDEDILKYFESLTAND